LPMHMNNERVSIIVPTLNEEGNVEELVRRIHEALRSCAQAYEIIFVDDHSSDRTREIVESLADAYPVSLFLKRGEKGKARSLLEGFGHARYEVLAILDADLQYPPETIPEMLERMRQGADVVVANRVEREVSFVRKFLSKGFALFFSRFLHGLDCDVQAGLKVFRREIVGEVSLRPSPWTFDLDFLAGARNYGYEIASVDMAFAERRSGRSKVVLWKAAYEIGWNAIKLKFKKRKLLQIPPRESAAMIGAGVAHYGRRFVTHTTLQPEVSAFETFVPWQKRFLAGLCLLMAAGFFLSPLTAGTVLVALLSTAYFSDTVFSLYLVIKSLKRPPEIMSAGEELGALDDAGLPTYSILCPLYRESGMLGGFLRAIEALDWPKDKLDVLFLLEENDRETIEAAKNMRLPAYVRVIVVPDSQPKTKPKACNYGLAFARGEYVVIYDAEDIPDPLQLKKAYLGFQKVSGDVKCLQAKLNYFNPNQNLLTRLFTAEYSLWFDVILPGLQSINTAIPLGGTSNHFRREDLAECEGWDPFNVTEDCDLGVRMFKRGFRTAIIDSVTLEEANSHARNWIRQRSRWIKGYMQTYLVHMRHPLRFFQENGVHALLFHLMVGLRLAFLMINPVLWLVTAAYFLLNAWAGPTIEALYPMPVFYMAATSMIFGNFLALYYYMIGCAKRGHWEVVKYVFFVPAYWFMGSVAACIATYQLFTKPHYWEKTRHGLHLKTPELVAAAALSPLPTAQRRVRRLVFSTGGLLGAWARLDFAWRFFLASLAVNGIASLFLYMSMVIVDRFVASERAGQYAILFSMGQAIYLLGIAPGLFLPWMARRRSVGTDWKERLYQSLHLKTFFAVVAGVLVFGVAGERVASFLWRQDISVAEPLSFLLALSVALLALAQVTVAYRVARGQYAFAWTFLLVMSGISLGVLYSRAAHEILSAVAIGGGILGWMLIEIMHMAYGRGGILRRNPQDFFGAFQEVLPEARTAGASARNILIFNWRDTRHKFAGGAEVYIHEIAKRWVAEGNRVTVFCGNDGKSLRNETVDGVEVVRRGGFYFVYVWAFVYYFFRFRGRYDIVVDCQNGIPFFSPLYVKEPVYCLMHHVHQRVFFHSLSRPLALFASFLEKVVMPAVYRKVPFITVSESSRRGMGVLGLGKAGIEVIHPGTDLERFSTGEKSAHPSVLYLGRLKAYKSVDVLLRAFVLVVRRHPQAMLVIAGDGEELDNLKRLAKRLDLDRRHLLFIGKVSEEMKLRLLQSAWVLVNPSLIEGWGIVNIEANACGTPVIASNVPGLRDSVQNPHTGYLVRYGDEEAFAERIGEFLDDERLRDRMGRNALQWAGRFEWQKSSRRFFRLLKGGYP
jgi:cellulose synthase/poly-beta-1,6-N-acetylglucosamine synthase-like glycosyltransferase/glycosyltransferase involved in cell wall biosynthesis